MDFRPHTLVLVFLVLLVTAVTAGAETPSAGIERGLDGILEGYNAGIAHAMTTIETLRVEQEMLEPTDDGGEKRASAVLTYGRGGEMVRDESFSDLGHPVGEYTLESLVGPTILLSEYDITLDGVEPMEGVQCYRLTLTATERDTRHFDGTVWIETEGLGLVRITGEVADPPFPVQRITLDKAFESVPEGFRLLRRHSGEVDIKIAFVSRHGMMHIFYGDYTLGSR